ncbi:semaphorin-4A-like [Zootoca vivipara]|uniref:semaphorin-4A-like n=1 Tax=Zootoca vivipara TaxID=8524 RepID=UPI00158FDC08|nr:semaphorin-4A-like [Zootoca vivipara]
MNSKHFFICLLTFANALATELMPKQTTPLSDPRRKIFPFMQKGVQNWDTFLLSKNKKTLYAGARDTIFALDIRMGTIRVKHEIQWSPTADIKDNCALKVKNKERECLNFIRVLVQLNNTHLYTCGTYAFNPTCAYIDLTTFSLVKDAEGKPLLLQGKGVSPYSPHYGSTAILVDGKLYTATQENLPGNEPVIIRTLGSSSVLKNEHWMSDDATFVASFNIPTPANDDKVYFFFWETAKEFDFFEKVIVSRVARICKNDVGGKTLLQKKWTTFLKAHLSCAKEGQFPYSVIQHMFAVPHSGGGAFFYGVFVPQWQVEGLWSSAVCVFDLCAINKVFDNGRYKELHNGSRWLPYEGEAMDPRPGSCSASPPSDKTLVFMKEHYMMDQTIQPLYNQPVFVKLNVKYTRITVHKTENILGIPYTILFLGTDQGAIHKVVVVGSEAHIIEEIQLFEEPEAVQNLLLLPEKGILYVGYSKGIVQVPLANCGIHKTCPDCILARDPYCAWDGRKCSDNWNNKYKSMAGKNDFKQDVETGNPGLLCTRSSGKSRASSRPITLIAVVAVVFFCYPDTVKVKSKVQGCRSPLKANKTSRQEKVLFNGSQSLLQVALARKLLTAPTPAMSTCSIQAIRATKNCLDLGLPNRDDSRGAVAEERI